MSKTELYTYAELKNLISRINANEFPNSKDLIRLGELNNYLDGQVKDNVRLQKENEKLQAENNDLVKIINAVKKGAKVF